jgi:hypothetical protein
MFHGFPAGRKENSRWLSGSENQEEMEGLDRLSINRTRTPLRCMVNLRHAWSSTKSWDLPFPFQELGVLFFFTLSCIEYFRELWKVIIIS